MSTESNRICHRTTYRVIYGDTDTMGIVYHANYLRWFEMGRTELFRHLGLPYREIEARGLMLPVSEVNCKYLTPARYDDILVIEATLNTAFRAGMQFDYTITSEDGSVTHTTGYTRHAFVNGQGKVVRPPDFIREMIKRAEG
ncbi:acyl-CoA thioesterase [Desulfosarcina ovata]|uniref:Thioesterase n=1 Tax=Desulfosarcina ovata subsp. ovata TaxID=2752305 RepID=A0A5K8AHD2_9BACT|nr:thioesterase family protein [Desulfosarcina ovata]BBO92041.1 thioesterase [Desulfosarcina ovata subsp. ovata]